MSQLLLQRLSKSSSRNISLIHEKARRVLSSSAATNPYVSLEISADLNEGGGTIIGSVLLFDAAKHDVLTVEKTIPEEMIVEGKGVGASHGWLFMEDQRDRSLSVTDVLNPLPCKRETTVIPLPPLASLQLCQSKVGWNVAMSTSPDQDDEDDWVVAIKFLGGQLSLCRPRRDLRWTNIQTPLLGYLDNSNLMYSKRDQCFYLPSPGGHHLFSYDIKDKDHPNPKFHVLQFRDLPELPQSEWEILVGSCYRTEYLVESASTGEHFLVKRYLYLSLTLLATFVINFVTETSFFRYIQTYLKNGQDYKTKQFMVFREEETLEGGRYMCYTDNIGDANIEVSANTSQESLSPVNMSHRIKDHPPRVFFRCGNPFKNLFPKTNNARISPNLLSLLNSFETSLMLSIRELIPKDDGNAILTVSWMKEAMASLCETHKSIRTLVTDLELHVSDLEENFIYIYSDISSKLLELCNSFTSELDRVNHGNMLLKFTFSKLETSSCSEEISLLHLESWRQHMASKNPRIENCGAILSSLVESLKHHHHSLSKKKLSGKGKVLLRALYGVKVKTLYITTVFAAVFSGSSNNLLYLTIPKEMEEVPWAQGFMELQNMVNPEIKNAFLSDRFTVIKDLEAVELGVKKLHTAVQEGSDTNVLVEVLKKSVMELSERFDLVSKETGCLVKTVISSRDALVERLWTKYEDELGVKLPMMISVKRLVCE
ncbi:BnaA09g54170D [Brassica napus]|uniref:(rape) hypothetical protein n=1 Tax=Brassica napus TaxID=3708 RepID=A0A078INW7_BRANA|nr:unnamed protein product [Brassica napus]CDY50788.1 BnaA09g54170D [Brassica napus]